MGFQTNPIVGGAQDPGPVQDEPNQYTSLAPIPIMRAEDGIQADYPSSSLDMTTIGALRTQHMISSALVTEMCRLFNCLQEYALNPIAHPTPIALHDEFVHAYPVYNIRDAAKPFILLILPPLSPRFAYYIARIIRRIQPFPSPSSISSNFVINIFIPGYIRFL